LAAVKNIVEITRENMKDNEQITSFLATITEFDQEELLLFLNSKTTKTLKKGDFLIREGENCKAIYFIHSGILSLFFKGW
jgi:CRP-like cAMP-binding protein